MLGAYIVFLACLLLVHPAVSSSNVSWNDDVLGLLVFKSGVRDPDGALASWNEDDSSPCHWTGVQCNSTSGRVESLLLEGLSLSGQVGRGLLKLDGLKTVSLARNNLSGSIDQQLTSQLESLDLSRNRLSGPISGFVGASMRYLDLSDNALAGPLPSEFFQQCQVLSHLSLARNRLQGFIPSSVGTCSQLLVLDVSWNQFQGQVPAGLRSLNRLKVLDLSENHLTGAIPSDVSSRLQSLTYLGLGGNLLSGNVPSELGSCTLLKYLDLGNNQLTGELPQHLQQLVNLVTLNIRRNAFVGTLPDWIGSQLRSLEELDMSHNGLHGRVPDSFGNLSSLRTLNLAGNMLTGELPESIFKLASLSILDGSHNHLSGDIPSPLFSSSLQSVNLSSNSLVGKLTISSSCAASLQVLDLSGNQVYAPIPSEVYKCPALRHLNLGSNLLAQEIPATISELKLLEFLDLSQNRLSGTIPKSISNMTSLKVLDLRKNTLGGPIPSEIGSCLKLSKLDLSINLLNGSIPSGLAKLSQLRYLDLSWNNFSGSIPSGGVFQLLNRSSFQGNAALCGSQVSVVCPLVPKPIVLNPNTSGDSGNIIQGGSDQQRGRSKIVLSVSAIIAISAAAVIALGIVVVSVLNIRAQATPEYHPPKSNFLAVGSSSSPSSSLSEDFAIGKLVMFTDDSGDSNKSEELLPSAHALLNKDCEIGRGTFGVVYKTTLKNGQTYAVKKLMVTGPLKSQLEFEREVQHLGKIQHPNLVTLQGYYWTSRMQLLISDFLPNGNLYSRLHELAFGEAPLSWSDRFQVGLGIAQGLSHLHHGVHPPVVHYNLKSSNILLTRDNRPQISDYGLASLLPVLDRLSMSGKFQGALGYMAPELACQSHKVSDRCDVYSFGIILLELVTGRRPVEYMEDDVVILCDSVRSRLEEGRAISCLDPVMGRLSAPEEEVLPVIKLGLICASQVPSSRPSMAEVVQILELVKPAPAAGENFS